MRKVVKPIIRIQYNYTRATLNQQATYSMYATRESSRNASHFISLIRGQQNYLLPSNLTAASAASPISTDDK